LGRPKSVTGVPSAALIVPLIVSGSPKPTGSAELLISRLGFCACEIWNDSVFEIPRTSKRRCGWTTTRRFASPGRTNL
jgi:hypothetical protein